MQLNVARHLSRLHRVGQVTSKSVFPRFDVPREATRKQNSLAAPTNKSRKQWAPKVARFWSQTASQQQIRRRETDVLRHSEYWTRNVQGNWDHPWLDPRDPHCWTVQVEFESVLSPTNSPGPTNSPPITLSGLPAAKEIATVVITYGFCILLIECTLSNFHLKAVLMWVPFESMYLAKAGPAVLNQFLHVVSGSSSQGQMKFRWGCPPSVLGGGAFHLFWYL